MLRSLGKGGGILLMRKFRKDACDCRIVVLWGCSIAEIWGSDSRLVFLLHNQFAVWIPFYTTLNMHCSLDPAKTPFLLHQLYFISFSPAHIHDTVQNSFTTNLFKISNLLISTKCMSFSTTGFCSHCIFGQYGGLTRGVIICVCE